MNAKKKPDKADASIAENRKARFDYFIDDTYEAGLALQGWEVESLRAGRAQLKERICHAKRRGVLYGANSHCPRSHTLFLSPPPRKLLLTRADLDRRPRSRSQGKPIARWSCMEKGPRQTRSPPKVTRSRKRTPRRPRLEREKSRCEQSNANSWRCRRRARDYRERLILLFALI